MSYENDTKYTFIIFILLIGILVFISVICAKTFFNYLIRKPTMRNDSPKAADRDNRYMHYWIDPKIFSGENQKYESFLKKFIDL